MIVKFEVFALPGLQRQLTGGEQQLAIHRPGAHFAAARAIDGADGDAVQPCAFIVVDHPFAGEIRFSRQGKGQVADRDRLRQRRCQQAAHRQQGLS